MSGWKSKTYTASELAEKIRRKELTVPPYQRGQVWKESQETLLIDSIKMGFPFGAILLYKKADNDYQLIDGLQRMTTIYKYLNNPTKFFKEEDLDDEFLTNVATIINVAGNQDAVKQKISQVLVDWLKTNYKTMEDVKDINYMEGAIIILNTFPSANDTSKMASIHNLLRDKFKKFSSECEQLANSDIPAIVYEGNPVNLPTIFRRMNSKGTPLSKYQILAATWTHVEYKITNDDLKPIVDYVNKFYVSLINNDFGVHGFSLETGIQNNSLNLYQLIFGFGKLITERYPLLFGKLGNDKDVESCSFNLINACLANKNSKIEELPNLFKKNFKTDDDINNFLIGILRSIKLVNDVLSPYLRFKLNSRKENTFKSYHTEMQICAMIANVHNARFLKPYYDDDRNLIDCDILVNKSNDDYANFKSMFKKNAMKRYTIDVLSGEWSGTGDKKLDEISMNKTYYSTDIDKKVFVSNLDGWFNKLNDSRREYVKVNQPESAERLLLSIIYINKFTAFENLSNLRYDIEHLATKGLLKEKLKKFDEDDNARLPISSFGNLCLLLENNNRRKKDKTLYQDTYYMKKVSERNIQLNDIETRFSFTTSDSMSWCENDFTSFEKLKKAYFKFITDRFEIQKKYILSQLGY